MRQILLYWAKRMNVPGPGMEKVPSCSKFGLWNIASLTWHSGPFDTLRDAQDAYTEARGWGANTEVRVWGER